MTTVERLIALCNEKKISIHKLEKECGFGNGYIARLKKGVLPDNRLQIVANYLEVSAEYLSTGKEKEPVDTDSFTLKMQEISKIATPEQKKMILQIADTVLHSE